MRKLLDYLKLMYQVLSRLLTSCDSNIIYGAIYGGGHDDLTLLFDPIVVLAFRFRLIKIWGLGSWPLMVRALTGWPVKFTSCRAMVRSYSTIAADNSAPGQSARQPNKTATGFMSFISIRRSAF